MSSEPTVPDLNASTHIAQEVVVATEDESGAPTTGRAGHHDKAPGASRTEDFLKHCLDYARGMKDRLL
jgi:hypothetical protein